MHSRASITMTACTNFEIERAIDLEIQSHEYCRKRKLLYPLLCRECEPNALRLPVDLDHVDALYRNNKPITARTKKLFVIITSMCVNVLRNRESGGLEVQQDF